MMAQRAGKGNDPSAGQAWLAQTSEPWLVVLDNANDPDMDLSMFIPISGNGHILITSRNPGAKLYNTVGCLDFKGMDPEEAITLLLRLAYPDKELHDTTKDYRVQAGIIASELGYLALALKQAAYTIRTGLRPLEVYLISLLGCRKELLSKSLVRNAEHANILATWELPFTSISNRQTLHYRDAVDLIHIFAFMHFVSIPSSIFSLCSDKFKLSKGLTSKPGALVEPPTIQMVEDRVLNAARVLYDHSIISITEVKPEYGGASAVKHIPKNYFTMHPAIHEWARLRMEPAAQLKWLNCAATILEHSVSANMEMSGATLRRLLLPHIEFCLSLLQKSFPDLPETHEQASQLEKFGLVYAEAGRWKTARSLQLSVVSYRQRTLGKRDPCTIRAQKALASTYWNLFEVGQCLDVQYGILITQWWSRPSWYDWTIWPPWRPNYIAYCATLGDLTQSLWLAGQRNLAKRTGRRAVEGLVQSRGPDDPLTLNAMFNLARTYLHLSEHRKSYELLEEVLAKREHFFGPEHLDTLMTRNELGMNLFAQKTRLLEAETLVRGVLESRRRILGEEHAYTLWSINDLSKVWCELRRFDEARVILEEILPIVHRTLGYKHAGMIMTKANLTRVYILCNMLDKAAELITDLRKIVPPDHPDWIHAEWAHAFILFHRDDNLADAEKCCLEILAHVSDTGVLAPENPRVVATAELLLEVYQRQDRETKILELKRKMPHIGTNEVGSSIDFSSFRSQPYLRQRITDEPERLQLHSASTF